MVLINDGVAGIAPNDHDDNYHFRRCSSDFPSTGIRAL
jgi:hypothetical protein